MCNSKIIIYSNPYSFPSESSRCWCDVVWVNAICSYVVFMILDREGVHHVTHIASSGLTDSFSFYSELKLWFQSQACSKEESKPDLYLWLIKYWSFTINLFKMVVLVLFLLLWHQWLNNVLNLWCMREGKRQTLPPLSSISLFLCVQFLYFLLSKNKNENQSNTVLLYLLGFPQTDVHVTLSTSFVISH